MVNNIFFFSWDFVFRRMFHCMRGIKRKKGLNINIFLKKIIFSFEYYGLFTNKNTCDNKF